MSVSAEITSSLHLHEEDEMRASERVPIALRSKRSKVRIKRRAKEGDRQKGGYQGTHVHRPLFPAISSASGLGSDVRYRRELRSAEITRKL